MRRRNAEKFYPSLRRTVQSPPIFATTMIDDETVDALFVLATVWRGNFFQRAAACVGPGGGVLCCV
jgi:hypothetical protein